MKKILIAYFTWSNTSYKIAKEIHDKVDSDIFHINTIKKYAKSYTAATMQAGAEKLKKSRPKLTSKVENIEIYDTIILIYPNWWGTVPMGVCTFLEESSLQGKKIIPICMNEGSGLGKSINDIKELCPGAVVLDGLAIRGSQVDSDETRKRVAGFLKI